MPWIVFTKSLIKGKHFADCLKKGLTFTIKEQMFSAMKIVVCLCLVLYMVSGKLLVILVINNFIA